jgi:hypothetical protein
LEIGDRHDYLLDEDEEQMFLELKILPFVAARGLAAF